MREIHFRVPSSAGSIGGGVCGLIDEAHGLAEGSRVSCSLVYRYEPVGLTRITISRKPQKKEELPVSRSSDRTDADS